MNFKKQGKIKTKRSIVRLFGRLKTMLTDLVLREISLAKRELIMELSIIKMATFIWESGEKTNLTVKACIFLETANNMKVHSKTG